MGLWSSRVEVEGGSEGPLVWDVGGDSDGLGRDTADRRRHESYAGFVVTIGACVGF